MKLNFTSIPRDYWNWRCSALLLVVALTSIVSLTWLSSDHQDRLAVAASLDGLVRGPATIAATLCFLMAWRVSGKPQLIWLSAATAAIAAQSVVMSRLQVADVGHEPGTGVWLFPFDLLSLLLVMRLSVAAVRRSYVGRPLLLGLAAGLALGAGRVVAALALPQVGLVRLYWLPLALAFVVAAVGLVRVITLVPEVPAWASGRLGSAVALFGAGHLVVLIDAGRDSTLASALALAADLGGAILLTAGAVAMLVMTVVENRRAIDRLQVLVDQLEAGRRTDRARIHEIDSTLAGVVSASRLLHEEPGIERERRVALDNMMQAELARLQRLLSQRDGKAPSEAAPPPPCPPARTVIVDLDDTIGNLVVSQEVRGNRVTWLPSGEQVEAEPDAVAEVLNILLDNAAKHGASDASVTVKPVADAIEVSVSDRGPGIEPEVRQHLFEWGGKSPRSRGQGIGLHIAHDLTVRHGGYLRVGETTAHGGATFVAAFPRARRGGNEPAHIA